MTKVERAIQYAVFAHANAKRKGKERPYILHPLETLTIAASITEDEDVLAAAVLHDVVEDTKLKEDDILKEFGEKVTELVMAESEDKMTDIPSNASWKTRKQCTIDHIGGLPRDAKIICLGDKLANIREISRDYEILKDELWQRFNQKDKKEHAWYYRTLCDRLEEEFGDIPVIQEYRALLKKVFGEI